MKHLSPLQGPSEGLNCKILTHFSHFFQFLKRQDLLNVLARMMRPVSDQVVCIPACFLGINWIIFLAVLFLSGLYLELLAVCVCARKSDAFLPKQMVSFLNVQLHLLSAGKEMMSVTACNSRSILTERTVAHIVCPGVQVSLWTLFLYVLEFICVCVNMGTCIPAYMCASQRATFGNQFSPSISGSGDQIQAFRLALQGAHFKPF